MRAFVFHVSGTCLAFATAAACAMSSSDAQPVDIPSGADGGVVVPLDGAPADDARMDVASSPERCSAAGWCLTDLPDSDLRLEDVWPVGDRAFAVGTSAGPGKKALEWDGAQWRYIDDNTQNELWRTQVANVWAPSQDEVYFGIQTNARVPVDGGVMAHVAYVFHGVRGVPPSTTWTWTRHDFQPCSESTTAQVWGTSRDDVYYLWCRRIHRLSEADGEVSAAWSVDYVDEDPANPMLLFGATGSGRDDVWFVGARGPGLGTCSLLVHKTAAGYERIADGVPNADGTCADRPGFLKIDGTMRTAFHTAAKDRFIGARETMLAGPSDVVRIAPGPAGGYAVSSSNPSMDAALISVWGLSEDDLWFIAARPVSSGPTVGGILRGLNLWNDGGAYQYSTLVLNGVPNTAWLTSIRGTSNDNLWAVGNGRAYHKTTP
jgi:hypothetical protein